MPFVRIISPRPIARLSARLFYSAASTLIIIHFASWIKYPQPISACSSVACRERAAQSALTQWIEYLSDKKQKIPKPTMDAHIKTADGEFVNLVRADVKDGRSVKRTVSLPKWLDEKAAENNLSLSRVLQDALISKLPTA
jgi:hypothetical protein